MKRAIFSILALVACAQQRAPSSVQIVLPLPTHTTLDGTLLGECRIAGDGDRKRYDLDQEDAEFDIFASRETRSPALVITSPSAVHVAWSQFPAAIASGARARIEIGGQRHVRFTGWSSLSGRTFSLSRRFYAEPGHLWARIGAPVEMVAAEGDTAYARVKTPFVAPSTLVVRGACASVMYQPQVDHEQDSSKRKPIADVLNHGAALDLYTEPTASKPFTTLTIDGAETLSMDELEVRDGFAHVAVDFEDVGFDAWVPIAEVTEDPGAISGIGLDSFGTSSRCGGGAAMVTATVTRDAPLYVGNSPEPLVGAVVEKDAVIEYASSEQIVVGGRTMVWFIFVDGMINAPDNSYLWIPKDLLN